MFELAVVVLGLLGLKSPFTIGVEPPAVRQEGDRG